MICSIMERIQEITRVGGFKWGDVYKTNETWPTNEVGKRLNVNPTSVEG